MKLVHPGVIFRAEIEPSGLQTLPPGWLTAMLALIGPSAEYFRMNFPDSIIEADTEHGLPGILEDVNHLALRVFHVNALAIGQQVIFRTGADR